MTLSEIKALVLRGDPEATRYESAKRHSEAYTVWREVRMLGQTSEDGHEAAWAFQIDRFTKEQNDPIAATIRAALEDDERVAYSYEIDYEPDTRYIHHIFDCEGY